MSIRSSVGEKELSEQEAERRSTVEREKGPVLENL